MREGRLGAGDSGRIASERYPVALAILYVDNV